MHQVNLPLHDFNLKRATCLREVFDIFHVYLKHAVVQNYITAIHRGWKEIVPVWNGPSKGLSYSEFGIYGI